MGAIDETLLFQDKIKDTDESISIKEGAPYSEWIAQFIASRLVRDVTDEVAARKLVNKVDIYPWKASDFVEFSAITEIDSIKGFGIIRDNMIPQIL